MSFDPIADLMNGLNTTATGERERSRPCPGLGIYILESFGPKNTEKGVILCATLRVGQPAPGSQKKSGDSVEIAWFISKPKTEGGENEKARGRDFVNALVGAPKGSPAGETSLKLSQPTQPGMGICIAIDTKTTTYKKKDGTPGTGSEYTYSHVPGQAPEAIAANRAALIGMAQAAAPAAAPPPYTGVPHAAATPAAFPMQTATVAPTAPPVAPPAPAAGSPLAFLFK